MENHTKGGQTVFYKEGQAPIKSLPERAKPRVRPEAPEGTAEGSRQVLLEGKADNPLVSDPALENASHKLWEKVLSKGNYTIFMTVAFAHRYADKTSLDGVNFLLKVLNRGIWGNRYGREPTVGLKGIVVAEPHGRISRDFGDRLHFHIMLEEQPEIADLAKFRALVVRELKHVKCNGRCMLDKRCVDVQAIYDVKGLADYLTKCMRRREWKDGDNICFLRPGGIDGVCIPHNRPILNS